PTLRVPQTTHRNPTYEDGHIGKVAGRSRQCTKRTVLVTRPVPRGCLPFAPPNPVNLEWDRRWSPDRNGPPRRGAFLSDFGALTRGSWVLLARHKCAGRRPQLWQSQSSRRRDLLRSHSDPCVQARWGGVRASCLRSAPLSLFVAANANLAA